jgi:hypothetical protein
MPRISKYKRRYLKLALTIVGEETIKRGRSSID